MDAGNLRKVRLNPELIQLSASRSDDRAVKKKKNLRVFIYKGSSGHTTTPILPILDDFAVGSHGPIAVLGRAARKDRRRAHDFLVVVSTDAGGDVV